MEHLPSEDEQQLNDIDRATNRLLLQESLETVRHFAQARHGRPDIHEDDLAQSVHALGVRLLPVSRLGWLVLGTPPDKRPARTVIFGPKPGSRLVSAEWRDQTRARAAAIAEKPRPLNLQTRKAGAHTMQRTRIGRSSLLYGIMLPSENDLTIRLRVDRIGNRPGSLNTERINYRMDQYRMAADQQPSQGDVRFDCVSSIACSTSPQDTRVGIYGLPDIADATAAHTAVMKAAVATMYQFQSVLATESVPPKHT